MIAPKKRIVVFISGGGSNMEMLVRAARDDDFPARIVAVFSDKANAGGLAKAQKLGIETRVFERSAFASRDSHEQAILSALEELSPDALCLAGYMRLISAEFVARYKGRILNIHPSLLPLFPGLHTHQRAIDAGMKIAGCTVHLVTEGMDEGPILAQAAVPILEGDTADALAVRILTVEHRLYAAALRRFCQSGGLSGKTDATANLLSFG